MASTRPAALQRPILESRIIFFFYDARAPLPPESFDSETTPSVMRATKYIIIFRFKCIYNACKSEFKNNYFSNVQSGIIALGIYNSDLDFRPI